MLEAVSHLAPTTTEIQSTRDIVEGRKPLIITASALGSMATMMDSWCFVLAAVVALICPSGVSSTRSQCVNYGRDFDCSNVGIVRVPQFTPINTTVLGLGYNKLSVIGEQEFLNKGLVNLVGIYIQHNTIAQLEELAFSGLSNLSEVDLSYNNITAFNKNIFMNNSEMQILWLDKNPLSLPSTEELSLLHSASLAFISLRRCNLTRLTRGFFTETPNLIVIKLENNRLTTLEWCVFRHLKKLKHLFVNSNEIKYVMCDKELVLTQALLNSSEDHTYNIDKVPSGTHASLHVNLKVNPLVCDCCLCMMTYAMEESVTTVTGSCKYEDGGDLDISVLKSPLYLTQCIDRYHKDSSKVTRGVAEEVSIDIKAQTESIMELELTIDNKTGTLEICKTSLEENESDKGNNISIVTDMEALARVKVLLEDDEQSLAEDKIALETYKKALEIYKKSLDKYKAALEEKERELAKYNRSLEENKLSVETKNAALEADWEALEEYKISLDDDKVSLEQYKRELEDDKESLDKHRKILANYKLSLEKDKKSMENDNISLGKENTLLEENRRVLAKYNTSLEQDIELLENCWNIIVKHKQSL